MIAVKPAALFWNLHDSRMPESQGDYVPLIK